LDEPAWSEAVPIGRLLQQEPIPESEPTEETDVFVLYDRDNVYFGIVCHDKDPGAIVATQMSRDARLDIDDHIVIAVDPFLDYRNGFFFEVNPVVSKNTNEPRTLANRGVSDRRVSALIGEAS